MILSHIMSLFLCSLFFLSINLIGCFKMLVNGDMGSVEIFLKGPMELSPFTIDTCPITQNLNKGFVTAYRLSGVSKSLKPLWSISCINVKSLPISPLGNPSLANQFR